MVFGRAACSAGLRSSMTQAVRWALVVPCLVLVFAQVRYSSSVYMAEAYILEALKARKGGDDESAKRYYLRAADLNPGDPELLYLLGNQWSRLGKMAEAKAAYARSLELAPHIPATLIKYAELLALSDEPKAADEFIGRALKLAPADWRAEEIAGLVRGVQGDYAGAAIHFERAQEFSGKPSAKLLNRLAYTLYRLADYERALGYVDQAVILDALHPDNHLLRGRILLGMKRPNDALGALASAEREYVRRAATNASENDKLQETRRYIVRAQVARGAAEDAAESLAVLRASQGRPPQ